MYLWDRPLKCRRKEGNSPRLRARAGSAQSGLSKKAALVASGVHVAFHLIPKPNTCIRIIIELVFFSLKEGLTTPETQTGLSRPMYLSPLASSRPNAVLHGPGRIVFVRTKQIKRPAALLSRSFSRETQSLKKKKKKKSVGRHIVSLIAKLDPHIVHPLLGLLLLPPRRTSTMTRYRWVRGIISCMMHACSPSSSSHNICRRRTLLNGTKILTFFFPFCAYRYMHVSHFFHVTSSCLVELLHLVLAFNCLVPAHRYHKKKKAVVTSIFLFGMNACREEEQLNHILNYSE